MLRNRHLGERTGPRRERPMWGPRHRVRAAPQTPCVARGPLGSSIISPPLPSTAQCGSRWWSGAHPCKYHQIPQLGILAMRGFPRERRCHHQVPRPFLKYRCNWKHDWTTRDQKHHDDVKHRPPTPHSEPCRERRGHVLTPPREDCWVPTPWEGPGHSILKRPRPSILRTELGSFPPPGCLYNEGLHCFLQPCLYLGTT